MKSILWLLKMYIYSAHCLCNHPNVYLFYKCWIGAFVSNYLLSDLHRIECGNETGEIGEHCSQMFATVQSFCPPQPILKTPAMPSRHASLKQPPTRCAAPCFALPGHQRADVLSPVLPVESSPSGMDSPSTSKPSCR